MKTIFTLFVLFLFTNFCSFAQESVFTLRIKDTQNKPIPNIVVTGEHSEGKVVLKATTNAAGEAVFKLSEPGFYNFSYLEMKNVIKKEVKEGFYGTFSQSVVYDPKGVFAEKPKADRTGIIFVDVPPLQLRNDKKSAEVTILVKKQDGTLVTNAAVKMICVADKTRFSSTSNSQGKALFYVPMGKDYEIDMDQTIAYKTLSVPNYEGLQMTEVVFYEKTNIREIIKGDTIIQSPITNTNGTSTHLLYTLTLSNYENKPLENEPIYMNAVNGKRVYKGVTNEKGICVFLLEKGTDYVLNFKYEQNVHLVEAKQTQGFTMASSTRRYRGSKEIEAILAAQKEEMRKAEESRKLAEEARLKQIEENKKLIAQYKKTALIPLPPITITPTYRETPVKSIPAPEDYLKKTSDGYTIDFNSKSGTIGTPTVIDNRLYSQQGVYSSNYFCLNAGTGGFVWGLELGESGLSPAVYHQGVILINTYSCTLYAIDAVSGQLLWSKWLAGTVYSTPTAADDDVFVVYKHGGKPVLVSFNLRSGKFNWMQEIDNEAIACPVVEGEEVHVASQGGTYYIFNKETGVRTATTKDVFVLSSPSILGDKIFVTARINEVEKLISLDRKTLDVKQVFDSPLSALTAGGAVEQMNFNGSHPVVYQNKYIVVTDSDHIYTFDALTEKKLWDQTVKLSKEQVPVIANNTIYVVGENGAVITYDIATGKQLKLLNGNLGQQTEGQPIFGNGFFFIAAAGILKAVKTTTKLNWNQWNKDAGHNLVWK